MFEDFPCTESGRPKSHGEMDKYISGKHDYCYPKEKKIEVKEFATFTASIPRIPSNPAACRYTWYEGKSIH